MNHEEPDFDVGIVGGGPAGASMAAYLAKAGVRCVVFEGDLFPRPHVGESFVPSSTRVFKDLDFLPVMEEHRFPRKYGAEWTVASSSLAANHGWEGLTPDCQADIRFDERDQPGVSQNYTYHVDRGKFDLLLLQHAHKLGATVYSGVTVKDVDLYHNGFAQLRVGIGRKERPINVRMVVDASGRRTFLGNRLKLKINDPVFDQYAIHTWFDHFDRGTHAKRDYIVIHFLPVENTWVWQIPITESITSIGVVTQKDMFRQRSRTHEQLFWDCIGTRPDIYERLKQSTQMRPFTQEGDYSYAMTEICGDRFVMIGDAARFVDPIFSTGVSIALNSARFAARDVISALERGDCSRQSFHTFETTIRRGTRNWYEFIAVYYRLNILFTAFINSPQHRLDVLKLLQGDVYDEAQPEILRKMRDIIRAVERDEHHIWHSKLGTLTADVLKSAFA
jgi:1H-pyrrole-2-carbonyl-[peptidyl-carrier protein] chlorinase